MILISLNSLNFYDFNNIKFIKIGCKLTEIFKIKVIYLKLYNNIISKIWLTKTDDVIDNVIVTNCSTYIATTNKNCNY